MERTAAASLMASTVDNPAMEIQDFDRVVQQYWPRFCAFCWLLFRTPMLPKR
jgi:hypothetical protein